MNNISKSIGWADLSWNPIKGICPVGCWYCYAKNIYKRFGLDPTPRLDEKELFAPVNRWGKRANWFGPAKRIFVCSTFDLFHPVADKWRDLIFQSIEIDLADTFIVLTKLPQNIDRPMPPNVWLGVSAETHEQALGRYTLLIGGPAGGNEGDVRFISYEPMLEELDITQFPALDWLIVGRLTGHGKKHNPKILDLEAIRELCSELDIPLFEKSNLRPILGDDLTQKFPASTQSPQPEETPAQSK